eukprot:gb/GECG01013691.1/.p1 GENE.gb/GECG01013691.1/~~gb/GECG01013691.1/.p1  ORF type:complete len:1092 (+),score=116.12 gb/GECG01013691.1/:1-3276(+)
MFSHDKTTTKTGEEEEATHRQPSMTSTHYGPARRRLLRSRSSPAIVYSPWSGEGGYTDHPKDSACAANTQAKGRNALASLFSWKDENEQQLPSSPRTGHRRDHRTAEQRLEEETAASSLSQQMDRTSGCGDSLKSHIGSLLSYITPPLLAVAPANDDTAPAPPRLEEEEEEDACNYHPDQPFSAAWLPPSPSINARTAFVDLHKEQMQMHYDQRNQRNTQAIGGASLSIKTPTSAERETSLPFLNEQGERTPSTAHREASMTSGPFAHEDLDDLAAIHYMKSFRPSKSTLRRFDSHMRKVHGRTKRPYRARRSSRGGVENDRVKEQGRCNCCKACYCLRKSCKALWTFLAGATVVIGMISLVVPVVMEVLDPEDVLLDQLLSSSWFHDVYNTESHIHRESRSPFSTGDGNARPGLRLAREGLVKKHPVVFVPGISSTGLELWQGKNCMKNSFRERIWGDSLMLRKIILNELCWLEHMMLNETTGLDPEDIKVRAASGIRAADYIMGYYSLWGTIVKNLADLGYDESSIYMASYDWRLGPHHQEIRDRAWTKLKNAIEQLYDLNGEEKVVVIGHSLGTNYFLYFLQWVERQHMLELVRRGVPKEQLGRNTWTDKYVGSLMNIAGPLLGVPKGIPSLYSGEMRDTAELGPIAQAVKEQILPRRHVKALFQSYGSVPAMLPLGGDGIWGSTSTSGASSESGASPPKSHNRSVAEGMQSFDDEASCIATSSRRPLKNVSSEHVAPDQVNGKGAYGYMMVLHHRMYGCSVEDSDSSLFGSSRQRAQTTANLASRVAGTVLSGLRWSQEEIVDESQASADSGNISEMVEVHADLERFISYRKECNQGFPCGNTYGRGTASSDTHEPSTVVSETSEGIVEYIVPDSTVDTIMMDQKCTYKGNCSEVSPYTGFFLEGNFTGSLGSDTLFAHSQNNSSAHQCGTRLSYTSSNDGEHRSGKFPLGPSVSRSYLSLEEVYELMQEQDPAFMSRLFSFINLTAARPPCIRELLNAEREHAHLSNASHTLLGLSSAFVPAGYDDVEIAAGMAPHQYWSNPLAVPLPYAPSMTIFSLYGVGSIAERAFHFECVGTYVIGARVFGR